MKLEVGKAPVWAAEVEDQPGVLAEKLEALSAAGANLGFLLARRAPEMPGYGVVFLTPLTGTKQIRAGRKEGFIRTDSLHSVRVAGPDKAGLGAKIARQLGDAGINIRGYSSTAIGKKFVAYLALDCAEDAAKAMRVLRKMK